MFQNSLPCHTPSDPLTSLQAWHIFWMAPMERGWHTQLCLRSLKQQLEMPLLGFTLGVASRIPPSPHLNLFGRPAMQKLQTVNSLFLKRKNVDLWLFFCLATPPPSVCLSRFDAHCCHMGTVIKHPVPDRVKAEYSDAQPRASECPDVKNYKWRLNPVWHRMYPVPYGNSGRQRAEVTTRS